MWGYFKYTVLSTAREICGIKIKNNRVKQTAWWTTEIKEQIKMQKKAWNDYLRNKCNDTYNEYKKQQGTQE